MMLDGSDYKCMSGNCANKCSNCMGVLMYLMRCFQVVKNQVRFIKEFERLKSECPADLAHLFAEDKRQPYEVIKSGIDNLPTRIQRDDLMQYKRIRIAELDTRYSLARSKINTSTFCSVYNGHRKADGLKVILKEYHMHHDFDLRGLIPPQHVNILPLLDCDGRMIFVRKRCDESLDELIKKKELSPGRILKIIYELLEVLKYLHQRKLYHGGLKPTNILFENGKLLLDDYMIEAMYQNTFPNDWCRAANNSIRVTPQIDQGGGKYDIGTDIWQVGFLVHQLVYGQTPLKRFEAPKINNFRSLKSFHKAIRANTFELPPCDPVFVPFMKKCFLEYHNRWSVEDMLRYLEEVRRQQQNLIANDMEAYSSAMREYINLKRSDFKQKVKTLMQLKYSKKMTPQLLDDVQSLLVL